MTRRKLIGDLGERWTKALLARAGFQVIHDLNERQYNHPGGDFVADRAGVRYFISVKARNKYRRGEALSLNPGYNIYPQKVQKHARPYDAIPAWLTIQIDTVQGVFSAYFGRIDQLRNPEAVAVPMGEDAVAQYECLARNQFDASITLNLSNQLTETMAPNTIKPLPKKNTRDVSRTAVMKFEEHLDYTDSERRRLLIAIRREVMRLDNSLVERITPAQRIAYSKPGAHIFLEIKVQRKAIVLHMIDVPDLGRNLSEIPTGHGWHQLTRRVKIERPEDLDSVLPLICAAWQRG